MKKFAFLISFLTCLLLSSCNSLNDEVVIVPNPDEPTNPDTPVEEDLYEEMYNPTSNLQITLNFTNEAIYKLAKYSLDEVKKEMYHPCDVTISLNDEVYAFLRQIANLTDQQFSIANPILDVSVGRYRISALHSSLARKNRDKVFNFSIRLGYDKLRIKDDGSFINKRALSLLDEAINKKCSIVIAGKTGTGKTEFQKFLISRMNENTRIILIDNINEFETNYFKDNLDSQTWLVNNQKNNFDDLIKNALRNNPDWLVVGEARGEETWLVNNQKNNFDDLIKNALRNNPDWLVVGEARGEEMKACLNSTMSGSPTITTMHARDSESIYHRIARMCMINSKNLVFEETLEDVKEHFKFLVYVKKIFDEKTKSYVRYVDSISTNDKGKFLEVYKYPSTFRKLPAEMRTLFEMSLIEFNKFNRRFAGVKE